MNLRNQVLHDLQTIENAPRPRVAHSDHRFGLEPVVHLNRIPEGFVCHLRYKFVKDKLTPGRPSFQIGHHMIGANEQKRAVASLPRTN